MSQQKKLSDLPKELAALHGIEEKAAADCGYMVLGYVLNHVLGSIKEKPEGINGLDMIQLMIKARDILSKNVLENGGFPALEDRSYGEDTVENRMEQELLHTNFPTTSSPVH